MSGDTAFFVASKLFWAVARPDAAMLLLTALGALALAVGFRRTGWTALASGLVTLLIASALPVADPLLLALERQYRPRPHLDDGEIAGIVVLGGAIDAAASEFQGAPNYGAAADRVMAAVALARRHPDAWILATGGSGALRPEVAREASLEAATLVDLGVSPSRIASETESRNTFENAELSLELVRNLSTGRGGRWVLVTSAFHMPRAVASFCSAGWTDLVPWPVDHRAGGASAFRFDWNPARNIDALNTAVKEWIGLLAYRLSWRIRAGATDGCVARAASAPASIGALEFVGLGLGHAPHAHLKPGDDEVLARRQLVADALQVLQQAVAERHHLLVPRRARDLAGLQDVDRDAALQRHPDLLAGGRVGPVVADVAPDEDRVERLAVAADGAARGAAAGAAHGPLQLGGGGVGGVAGTVDAHGEAPRQGLNGRGRAERPPLLRAEPGRRSPPVKTSGGARARAVQGPKRGGVGLQFFQRGRGLGPSTATLGPASRIYGARVSVRNRNGIQTVT